MVIHTYKVVPSRTCSANAEFPLLHPRSAAPLQYRQVSSPAAASAVLNNPTPSVIATSACAHSPSPPGAPNFPTTASLPLRTPGNPRRETPGQSHPGATKNSPSEISTPVAADASSPPARPIPHASNSAL